MQNLSWSETFQTVYGMRFVGLEDAGYDVYAAYGVPDPEAPYPRDFIIDPAGTVRYWSWEYDPQEIIGTIDALLAVTSVGSGGGRPVPGARDARLYLAPPSPSPARPGAEILYRLATPAKIDLSIYDPAGRLVRVLSGGERSTGEHILSWDGRNSRGRAAPSGVYFIVLTAGGETKSRRTVLLR